MARNMMYDRSEKLSIVQEAVRQACYDADCVLAESGRDGDFAEVIETDNVWWSFTESLLDYLYDGIMEYKEEFCMSCKYSHGGIPCNSCGNNPELPSNYELNKKGD